MPAPTRAPALYVAPTTPVPTDLIASVGALTGFGVIRFDADRPLYDDCFIDADGEMHPVECELSLPHLAQRIMDRAPDLALAKRDGSYVCTLKAGQLPGTGATLIEAVLRAFGHAKAGTVTPLAQAA